MEDDARELDIEGRDNVVGKVYQRLMEIESRLLPCGLHTIGVPPSAEEAIATLVNIAGIDRPEDNIKALPRIIADSIGRNIEDIYRNSNNGVLTDVELLNKITTATRASVRGMVMQSTDRYVLIRYEHYELYTTHYILTIYSYYTLYTTYLLYTFTIHYTLYSQGRVKEVNTMFKNLGSMFQGGSPAKKALSDNGFQIEEENLTVLFDYLEFCLKQIVADNEVGGLLNALDGKYIIPGPGGDPIRNPDVLPTGKNMHGLDPQSIPTNAAVEVAKVVVDRLIERMKKGTHYTRYATR